MKWESRTIDNLDYDIVTEDDGSRYVEVSTNSTVTGPAILRSEIDGIPVTRVREMAFWGNQKLTEVTIPSSVTSIGERAFESCDSLVSVEIPPSVTDIGACAFLNCEKLRNVTISSGVKRIGESAFEGCSRLTGVVIPHSVENIGDFAFTKCPKLKKLSIQAGNVKIGERAFSECESLKSVAICGGVAEIGDWAFSKCENLYEVALGEGVRGIGRESFWFCHGLTEVAIPSSVTNIGCAAFAECHNLKAYKVVEGNPKYKSEDGLLLSKDGKVLFAAPYRLTRVTIPYGVERISEAAFFGSDNLENVTIPSSVIEIGEDAFALCCSLTNVVIPDSVLNIGANAFCRCGFKKLTLPERFKDGANLTEPEMPEGEEYKKIFKEEGGFIIEGDDDSDDESAQPSFSVLISFYVRGNDFRYAEKDIKLSLDVVGDVIKWTVKMNVRCSKIWRPHHFVEKEYGSFNAFAESFRSDEKELLYKFIDYILECVEQEILLKDDARAHLIRDEIKGYADANFKRSQ